MITKRLLLIAAAAMLFASCCTGEKTQVQFLGPLQGECSGQPGFAYQGMDIYGDYMVSCQNQGIATVYRLSGDAFEPAGQFHLASFHEFNHANVASFGVEKASAEDPLPVIYVSQCHKKPVDGRKDVLYAERIAPDFSGSSLVQTIFYDDVNNDFGYALQWVIDRENRMLYGYGNTVNNSDPFNRHRIIKFRLPELSEGSFVVLKSEDALENYLIEDVSGFRFNPVGQGLFIRKGKLYMPTGVGKAETPSILYIWDLGKRSMRALDLSLSTTGEFEDISFYKGAFYIQGQDGIFKVKLGRNAGKADYDWHAALPSPVYDAHPEYLELYRKAWEQVRGQVVDISGDTVFLGHCCKYCPSLFQGVKFLDSSYSALLSDESAALPEEAIFPVQVWTEYRYAMQTGSKGRLKKSLPLFQRWTGIHGSLPGEGLYSGGDTAIASYIALNAGEQDGDFAREKGCEVMEYMSAAHRNSEQDAFCGMWPLGPISIFIEDVIGIKEADGFERTLLCDFEKHPAGKVGVRSYRFGDVVCDIIASEEAIEVESNRPFTLYADGKSFGVEAGRNSFPRN